MIKIPKTYRDPLLKYFPCDIDFYIPGYEISYPIGKSKTLALSSRDCGLWFEEFVNLVIEKINTPTFFPICRVSDGEFLFFLGEQPVDIRTTFKQKIIFYLSYLKYRFLLNGGFGALTQGKFGKYHSGLYTKNEWIEQKKKYASWLKKISIDGVLALHLNYEHIPFAERYYPAFARFLSFNKIEINNNNYYPFYFVYALLTCEKRKEIFQNRNILVINGYEDEKKSKVINALYNEGVINVYWEHISSNRSLFDVVDVEKYINKIDFVLLGAGIGKPNIIYQLISLNSVIIDAGFIFETWANPQSAVERPFCRNDFEEL
jgi:hypothetical protein